MVQPSLSMDTASAQFLIAIGALWTLIITILWLRIGWRAMRAHERLSASLDEIRYAIRTYVASQGDLEDR
jgi:hypothetical protein